MAGLYEGEEPSINVSVREVRRGSQNRLLKGFAIFRPDGLSFA
jgi:hypothetical protein